MIKVKDGYAKLIGTTYSGSADRVLLSNGGDKAISDFAEASALSNYVTLATAQTITGVKTFTRNTFILAGIEHNDIKHATQHAYNWGGYGTTNNTPKYTGMYNSLDFYWYNDIWSIGNLRSSGSITNGFGIGLKKTDNDGNLYLAPAFRITETESYINNNKIWHAGNDGSDSGLDADLLDGQHGNYYATASSLGNYLPLSGGTMTGKITMNTGTGLSMKYTNSSTTGDPWIYPNGADSYGIRYFEGSPDKMAISATGNNTTIAGADLCINGNGEGTVTIRGNNILHAGNYNSYAPTLTGTGASGTWGINITGSAGSATNASRLKLNGIADSTTYGTYAGIVQSSSGGPESGSWHSSLKILHNNSAGYYTQLAHNFTGSHGLWHRSNRAGTISRWYRLIDDQGGTIYGNLNLHQTSNNADSPKITFQRGTANDNSYYDWEQYVSDGHMYFTCNKNGSFATNVRFSDGGSVNATEFTGILSVTNNRYHTPDSKYGINMNNSDIIGANAIYFDDAVDGAGEGINFYRSSTTWDSLSAAGGVLYFSANRATATHTLTPVFSAMTNNSNQLDLTIGGQNRKLTIAYATNAATATSATSANYSRNLLGRNTSGTYYGAISGNLIFAEWNTHSDNRWYLKADGYETRVGYANDSNTLDGINSTGFYRVSYISELQNKDLNYANNQYGTWSYGDDNTQKNTPTTTYGCYLSWGNLASSDTSTTRNQTAQIGVDCWNDLGRIYVRARKAGNRDVTSIGDWRTIAFTSDIPISLKNPKALTAFGVTYDGSSTQTINEQTLINRLGNGDGDCTDNTIMLTSSASGWSASSTIIYGRPASKMYNYIKGKLDSVYLSLAGGTLTGPITIKKTITDEHWGAMTIKYDGSWSAHKNYIAGINVEDATGIVGRFGVTFDGNYGKFIVRGLYNSGYDKSGEVFSVNAVGDVTATKFIGSLSGNASSATKLTTNAGSATNPIYFSGGKPVACTYSLNKTVPADAKFTDTWPSNYVTTDTVQTITGSKTFNNGDQSPIILTKSSSDYISVRFDGSSGILGYLGFMGVDQPMYRRVSDNAYFNLLHSGNSSVSGGGSAWGSSITVKINGTSKTLTIPSNPNTDYRVTQSGTTTANYRPLVLGYTSVSTAGSGMTETVTKDVCVSNNFYVQPSTGTLYTTKANANTYMSNTYSVLGYCATAGDLTGGTAGSLIMGSSISTIIRSSGDDLYHYNWSAGARYKIWDAYNSNNYSNSWKVSVLYVGTDNKYIGTDSGQNDMWIRVGGIYVLNCTASEKCVRRGTSASDISLGSATYPWNGVYSTIGNFSGGITAAAFYESSDERLKNFIRDVEVDLDKIRELPKKYFIWKKDASTFHIGTSAQAVQKLYPELVSSNIDGDLSVDYAKLSIIALKAIDLIYETITDLKHENVLLKERVSKLEQLLVK